MKKKIAVIGLKGLPAYGGAATVGENIISQLKDEFTFTVFAVDSHVKDKNYNYVEQIVFREFPINKLNVFLYYIKSAFYVLFIRKFDLIHLHHIDAAFILILLRLRYKVISTNHGMPYLHGKWPFYMIPYFKINEMIHLMFSNKIVVVSKDLLRRFEKTKYKSKIQYIPNGTNNIEIEESVIHTKKYTFSFVAGRIIYIKGLHLLLQSLHAVRQKANLLVIGDLYHEKNYKALKIDPLLSGLNVDFKSVIYDKGKLFRKIRDTEIFVFPSLIEAMSTILLEVASLGIPIICSDIIQNKDIFQDDEVLYFKSNDVNDLSVKIHFALKNKEILKEKSVKAQKKVLYTYNWKEISDQYKKQLYSLLP